MWLMPIFALYLRAYGRGRSDACFLAITQIFENVCHVVGLGLSYEKTKIRERCLLFEYFFRCEMVYSNILLEYKNLPARGSVACLLLASSNF
jgi:hypothetical protein